MPQVFHMLSQAARQQLVPICVAVLTLTGCAAHEPVRTERVERPATAPVARPPAVPPVARQPVERPRTTAERAAVIAREQVGVPYRYGGNSRSGFDCSGLVHYAYSRAGLQTPRTTTALWRELPPVARDQLRTGDVLFFDIAGKISHVGLYLGQGRFVHAPSSGKAVSIANLTSAYYRQAFVRGGRPR